MCLRCLHTSTFIETPSLEWLPIKAIEDHSPHEVRLSLAGHQPSISWSREYSFHFLHHPKHMQYVTLWSPDSFIQWLVISANFRKRLFCQSRNLVSDDRWPTVISTTDEKTFSIYQHFSSPNIHSLNPLFLKGWIDLTKNPKKGGMEKLKGRGIL